MTYHERQFRWLIDMRPCNELRGRGLIIDETHYGGTKEINVEDKSVHYTKCEAENITEMREMFLLGAGGAAGRRYC